MERGISLRDNDPSPESGVQFLTALMDQLEQSKSSMPPFSKEEGKQVVIRFATGVFDSADGLTELAMRTSLAPSDSTLLGHSSTSSYSSAPSIPR